MLNIFQKFVPSRVQIGVASLLGAREYRRLLKYPALRPGVTNLFGKPLYFNDRVGLLHSLEEIFVYHSYRFPWLGKSATIIDAGSNIGLSVLYFRRSHPGCKISAFEPDPECFALLTRNIESHGLSDVDLQECAVWVADETLPFFREGSLAGSSHVDLRSTSSRIEVNAKDLKPLLKHERVTFLKLDIEGSENSVIPHIEDELSNVDFLFFEYHAISGEAQRLGEILSVVTRAGFHYNLSYLHSDLLPFKPSKSTGFDFQINVSCYRAPA